jgi:hypothetical protein
MANKGVHVEYKNGEGLRKYYFNRSYGNLMSSQGNVSSFAGTVLNQPFQMQGSQ